MKQSIIAVTAMLTMAPFGSQAPQETIHKPDNSITVSAGANETQRILCTLFFCRR
jgi:hypothetical protein